MSQPTQLFPVLSSRNSHERDANLQFDEPTHKYSITTDPGSTYTSVTTWNHSHFPHFNADEIITKMMKGKNWNASNKYWGLTSQQIKDQWNKNGAAVSGAGTSMHFNIECFMNNPKLEGSYTHKEMVSLYEQEQEQEQEKEQNQKGLERPEGERPNSAGVSRRSLEEKEEPDPLEWTYFIQYAKAFPDLKPYRTEWMIYHEELKLAGSIDMVYENPDGSLMIYDWKRCKDIAKSNSFNKYAVTECINNLPDTNFWHYSLQLNTYKAIIEAKYGKKVTSLYLVRLHPDNPKKTYELIKVPNLQDEIAELFELRRKQILL